MEAFAGRYRLIDLIGTGGMGSVWRAWDQRRSAYVAAKVLGQHDAATLLRFVREQSLRIEHPHVVAPHGWAADDDRVVFAMDLVRGGSVATLLGDHGPLPTAYVAVLLDQLLHGLSAVHAARVVHRDVKPANLLLDVTGIGRPHLRLSDFGVAGLLDEPRMTRHSAILGTPGYLAPEQLAGADPDPRQDLYAVGAVGIELLTGERPGIDGKLPEVDGPLSDFIRHLTAADPSNRPDTALSAGRLLYATGAIPSPETTPWSQDPDAPEVFVQLPPLPPPWTPTGPPPATPLPVAPAAHSATPLTAEPATPPAGQFATPPAEPSAVPSSAPPTGHSDTLSAEPATGPTAPSAAQAAQPAASSVAVPPPAVTPPAGHSAVPPAGDSAAPPGPSASPVAGRSAAQAAARAGSPSTSPSAEHGQPDRQSAEPRQFVGRDAVSSDRAVVASGRSARVLQVVAVVCLVGAVGLLGSAAWLLLR